MSSRSLKEQVKELAAACGYVACGITGPAPFEADRAAVEERIRQFPEAADLYRPFLRRWDPCRTVPWCQSVVVCIRWYGKYRLPEAPLGHIGRHYLGDCRLQECPDYHMAKKMTAGLRALGMRCKKGGVPDRWSALRAGVGRMGRNCFIYADGYGSWVNIQTWRVDARLEPDPPTLDLPCPAHCRRCIDACPTGAIKSARCMRMDECIAYLTYEAPRPVRPELRENMGPWIYGCDACQDVCPLNRGKWRSIEEAPWIADVAEQLTPAALAEMDDKTYRSVIHPLFWYISETDADRWRDNARRAVGRSG